MPILLVHNETIADSLAICEYVNEQYLANKAWPHDILTRAQARAVVAEMHSGFFALRSEMPMNCRRAPSSLEYSLACQHDIDRIITIWQMCLTRYQGPFLFGDFSIADVFYAPVIARFTSYQVKVPELAKQYMQQIIALPSYQTWLAQSAVESEVIAQAEL